MSVRIPFGKYVITSDQNGYALCRKRIYGPDHKEAGKEYLAPFKYWTTVEGLCKGLCEFECRESDVTTLKELSALVAGLCRDMTAIRRAITGEVSTKADSHMGG